MKENNIDIEKNFVTYDIALALKDLKFNEKCFAYFNEKKKFSLHEHAGAFYTRNDSVESYCTNIFCKRINRLNACQAPLWQQATDWLLESYNIHIEIEIASDEELNIFNPYVYQFCIYKDCELTVDREYYETLYEVREQAILKSIELLKTI